MSKVDFESMSVKQWEYMASQMAVNLREMASESLVKGAVLSNGIPVGVLTDALFFLRSARHCIRMRHLGWATTSRFPSFDVSCWNSTCEAFGRLKIKRGEADFGGLEIQFFLLIDFIQCFDEMQSTDRSFFSGEKFEASARWAASFFEALASLTRSE